MAQATTPVGASITLSAASYKVKGVQHVDLTWSGASAASVDIVRDGVVRVTTSNGGTYTDNIGKKGGSDYAYQVCEAGTAVCSNTVNVSF